MRVPLSWLVEFIEIKASPEEVAEIFTLGGVEVEEVFDPYEELGEIITVEIVEVNELPELKGLAICRVSDGKEFYTVITTAKDQVKKGLIAGLAKAGSQTFTGEKVEVKKIKKIKSEGMFISPFEAGLGEEKEKILTFPEGTPVGKSIYEVLQVSEPVLDLAVTPNRGDVLSILGCARELHTLTSWELKTPVYDKKELKGIPFPGEITILDKDGCFRYAGRFFRNIKVKESPFYIQKRLWLCGLRPINNIVDITNYVMLEIGQPLHAFDWKEIKGGKVVIRKAKQGEKLLMLDGVERVFTEEDLVIADEEKAMVLAGIMGGEKSGVSEKTEDVFLESAWFNPRRIRMSSQRHKISTESSYRFERRVDPEGVILGIIRASQLIKELAEPSEISEVVDVYPEVFIPPEITLPKEKVKKYLGFSISEREIFHILKKVGEVKEKKDNFVVKPFSFRQDLEIPEDLIEEIARIYGYDKIPDTFPFACLYARGLSPELKLEKKIRDILKGLGFFEVITYSFIDPVYLEKLFNEGDFRRKVLKLANPISSSQSVMRTSLVPGLLETAKFNFFREVSSLKIFEVGKVFFPGKEGLAEEKGRTGLLLMGNTSEEVWFEKIRKFDIYDLKGDLEEFFSVLGVEVIFKPYSEEPFLKKGISFDLYLGEKKIGFGGRVKDLILKELDLKTEIFVAEIDMDSLLDVLKGEKEVVIKKPPRYPSTFRDVTCVLKKEVKIGDILEFIESQEVPYLEDVRCIAVYEGPPIPEGEKSISLRFWYRAEDRTLLDEEVNAIQEELARKIFEKFSAKPR